MKKLVFMAVVVMVVVFGATCSFAGSIDSLSKEINAYLSNVESVMPGTMEVKGQGFKRLKDFHSIEDNLAYCLDEMEGSGVAGCLSDESIGKMADEEAFKYALIEFDYFFKKEVLRNAKSHLSEHAWDRFEQRLMKSEFSAGKFLSQTGILNIEDLPRFKSQGVAVVRVDATLTSRQAGYATVLMYVDSAI